LRQNCVIRRLCH